MIPAVDPISSLECIRLREYWNFVLCKEWEPYGLNLENRMNFAMYESGIRDKKFVPYGGK